jgi:hypothetical protein
MENSCIECFSGGVRDGLLNETLFLSLDPIRMMIFACRPPSGGLQIQQLPYGGTVRKMLDWGIGFPQQQAYLPGYAPHP